MKRLAAASIRLPRKQINGEEISETEKNGIMGERRASRMAANSPKRDKTFLPA